MNKFRFTVNGKDFSDIVHKYGYETALIPVFSKTVTTLDKVDHVCVVRWRGQLTVRINPVPAERFAEFCSELVMLPGLVGYHNFQNGYDVEKTMKVNDLHMALALITSATDYVDGSSITFDEL